MKKSDKILLISTIVLLFLAAIALPIASMITYALNETRTPDHILNYETNHLFWESGTADIGEDGVYRVSLFDSLPTDENGEKIISPGDEDVNIIQLRNKTGHSVQYKAVIYKISRDNVPIKADFTNVPASQDQRIYTLPDGVEKTDVVRAIGGELEEYGMTTFDLEWKWEYSVSDEQDAMDTMLGNLSSSDVTLGIWFTVTDNIDVEDAPEDVDVDTDGDGKPDVNVDTDKDLEPEINLDIDGDKIPDTNVDTDGDGKPDLSIDLDGDRVADFNFDSDGDGKPDTDVLGVKNENGAVILTPHDMEMIVDKFGGKTDLTLKLDNLGEYVNGVEFTKDGIAALMDKLTSIEIVMTNLKSTYDKTAMASIIEQAPTNLIRIVVKEILKEELGTTQQKAIEKHQVPMAIKAYIYSGDKVISEFGGGKATIHVPFSAFKNTRIIDYKLYYIKDNGELIDMNAAYSNKFFTFETDHYSEYVIIYHGKTDISGAQPAPPECVCKICLFGGNCTYCWLCWSFIIVLGLSIFVFLVITLKKFIK